MSTAVENTVEEKSEDKKEIEDEEREKMLNEENKRTATEEEEQQPQQQQEVVIKPVRREGEGEVEKMKKALEESEKESGKKKIPIGGIKMPGFLRSRSREKTKEGELDVEEGRDLLQEPPSTATNVTPADTGAEKEQTPPSKGHRLPTLKLANPFSKKKDHAEGSDAGVSAGGEEEHGKKTRLLEAIRLPLVSVFPRSKPKSSKDTEIGQQAGLASMETLDDSTGEKTEKMTNGDDGMESVKLDIDEKDPDKKEETDGKIDWRERIRTLTKFQLIIGGSVIFLILLIIIVAIAPFGSDEHSTLPLKENFKVAVTSCGLVEGVVEDGAYAFRGIPYAVPPIGERRWQSAKPLENLVDCWNGTLQVHNATPPCWQIYPGGTMNGVEDCLTLDVFTPHVPYQNPIPVVVLIGAVSLSGGSPGILYPCSQLARSQNVVFVRPNFRLGIMGFLAAAALKEGVHPPSSGNYGLSDIIVALKWIQLNIVHFGGDKDSVTLLGHRAGGTLVTALTASRKTKGLFKNAWVSSGAGIFPGKDLMESERDNTEFVEKLGCNDNAECLRNKDVEDILDLVPESWRQPLEDLPKMDDPGSSDKHQWLVLDGNILQEHVSDAWKANGIHATLVMGSTIHANIPPKLHYLHDNWTAKAVENHVNASVVGMKNLTSEVLERYGANWIGLVAMVSDIRTVCPLWYLSQQNDIPFYLVSHKRLQADYTPNEFADVSVDVEAILGIFEAYTPEEERYLKTMQDLFYHFVKHGELKKMTSSGRVRNQAMLIDQDIVPFNNFSNCNLWFKNDIVPRHGRID